MSFQEELAKLKEHKKQCLDDKLSLEHEIQREIRKAKEQVIDKYASKKVLKQQEVSESAARVQEYCNMIAKASHFEANQIGNTIASLIRTFEGINYIYQDTYYNIKETRMLTERNIEKNLRIVVALENKPTSYSDAKVASLVKHGKALVLECGTYLEDDIVFYRPNSGYNGVICYVDFKSYPYVKEFIDILVSYILEHQLKQITPEELKTLEKEFIASRISQIEENYQLVSDQQRLQMEDKLDREATSRKSRLARMLRK